ncbi:hypothetical protein [Flavihumibacter petaseus]|uniref:hypothetical protein n=1 Tax=Flavihumibacter petaseus TaxID=549295 RepID=UPI00061CEEA9|nr:hypothetical protein [Flavihumibacter petaseus]
MKKIKCLALSLFLAFSYSSFGQNSCGIAVDTNRIFLDKGLDGFLSILQSQAFETFKDKQQIPPFIRQQLNCLTNDKFSIANYNEDYRCCCTSSQELPRRKLLFFLASKDIFLIAYLTGGAGVSTTILMFRLQNEKVIDLWTGYGFQKFKSKDDVIKHIKLKRKTQFGLHANLSI